MAESGVDGRNAQRKGRLDKDGISCSFFFLGVFLPGLYLGVIAVYRLKRQIEYRRIDALRKERKRTSTRVAELVAPITKEEPGRERLPDQREAVRKQELDEAAAELARRDMEEMRQMAEREEWERRRQRGKD